MRKSIARIVSPKANLEDVEGARETRLQRDRRRVAYEKADKIIKLLEQTTQEAAPKAWIDAKKEIDAGWPERIT